jgi:hypothetical protein
LPTCPVDVLQLRRIGAVAQMSNKSNSAAVIPMVRVLLVRARHAVDLLRVQIGPASDSRLRLMGYADFDAEPEQGGYGHGSMRLKLPSQCLIMCSRQCCVDVPSYGAVRAQAQQERRRQMVRPSGLLDRPRFLNL